MRVVCPEGGASLTTGVRPADAPPGQVARRRFDHEEAIRRYQNGEIIHRLAREYGVTDAAVRRVVNPEVRAKMHAAAAEFLASQRQPCVGGCGRLVWMHGPRPKTGLCQRCYAAKLRAEHVPQHGTENEYKLGCRCGACTAAITALRRERRHRTRVPCSHGCGTMVDRNPHKDPECLPCFHRNRRRAAA